MIVQLTYGLMAVPAFSSPIGNTAPLLASRRAVEPDVDAAVRRPLRCYPFAHLSFQVRDLLRGALADVMPALGEISACLRTRTRRIHETVYRPDGASQRRADHERDGVPFFRHCQTSCAVASVSSCPAFVPVPAMPRMPGYGQAGSGPAPDAAQAAICEG